MKFAVHYTNLLEMKKALLTTIALMVCTAFATAQVKINLPYAKTIGLENGKWGAWPTNYVSIRAEYGVLPSMSIKLISVDTFDVELDEFRIDNDVNTERVLFDSEETKKARIVNANEKIMVYRFMNSDIQIWTENFSLSQIANDPSAWRKLEDAKIYVWNTDLGSGYLYTHRL